MVVLTPQISGFLLYGECLIVCGDDGKCDGWTFIFCSIHMGVWPTSFRTRVYFGVRDIINIKDSTVYLSVQDRGTFCIESAVLIAHILSFVGVSI